MAFMQKYEYCQSGAKRTCRIAHDTRGDGETPVERFWTDPSGNYCAAQNFTGWPAAVVRAGTSPERLPIGVDIAAKPWREDVAWP